MTVSSPSGRHSRISPFLLPYILADREDMDRLTRTAIEGSPSETMMLSPMEGSPTKRSPAKSFGSPVRARASVSPSRDPRNSASPHRASVGTSSPGQHRSMIEASIHDMTFDPDLTFMNSPGNSSAVDDGSPASAGRDHLSVSLPAFESPMRTVSPDRSIVPLDESEIGFSNELRASLQTLETGPITRPTQPADEVHRSKRAKLVKQPADAESHSAVQASNPPKSRSSRVVKTKTIAESKVEEVIIPKPETTPRLKPASKRKAEVVEEPPVSARRGRKRVAESDATPVQETASIHKQSKNAEPIQETSPLRRNNKPAPESELVRKSPRFASKVISTGADVTSLLTCPKCHKAYKRSRDFEKHVASCK